MKAIQFYVAVLILIFATGFTLNAQNHRIKGEGKIISKEVKLKTINSIGLGISGDVIITQGSKQSIRIEAQANIIDHINTEVKGTNWNIKFNERVGTHKGVTIYVTMIDLKELSVGGSGSIRSTNKFNNLENVELSIGGSGNIVLEMDAQNVDASIGGSGDMELKGFCNQLNLSTAGSGDVKAFNLSSENCKVSTTGSGDIQVNAKNNLLVSMAGSGDVEYTGNPKIKSSRAGSGSIEKKGNRK